MTRPKKFVGWWDRHEAALAANGKSRAVVTHVYDGAQLIGTVDRVGLRFESFSGTGRYLGRFVDRDLAVDAVHSVHQTRRIVAGLAN
ncbi:hypothetical protein [Devosia sp. RR2S18]|uniref:hypothetical protein n=1 Tax=Devosia rhizosphaerae TaxID=3049774 RepID=UPI00254236C4|nr:hypothetical protein [Devosia sp. RR2S18]WIJ24988.1 hypothetical protein QOV41_18565 [Devosia sp. RR2S18]